MPWSRVAPDWLAPSLRHRRRVLQLRAANIGSRAFADWTEHSRRGRGSWHIGWGEGVEKLAEGMPERVYGAGGGGAQPRFEFGERRLDRVPIGAVGWQVEQAGACRRDRLTHAFDLVCLEVIHDHDVARAQGRRPGRLDTGQEARTVDRALEHAGRGLFFRVSPQAMRKRLIADGLTSMPAAARRVFSSAMVMSGVAASSAWTRSAWSASLARRPPPTGSGSSVPLPRQRCTSLTTQLGLTSNFAAIARREAPAATARTIRSRRSTDYGRVIPGWPPQPSSQRESQQPHVVNPKSIPSTRIVL